MTSSKRAGTALGVVAEWSKVLSAVPRSLMVWSTLALAHISSGSYPGCFMSSFHLLHFISLYTLDGIHAFSKPLPYNMYLFNLRIANHILIKIYPTIMYRNPINFLYNLGNVIIWCVEVGPVSNAKEGSTQEHNRVRVIFWHS